MTCNSNALCRIHNHIFKIKSVIKILSAFSIKCSNVCMCVCCFNELWSYFLLRKNKDRFQSLKSEEEKKRLNRFCSDKYGQWNRSGNARDSDSHRDKKTDNNEKLKCVSVSFDSREIQQMNPFSLKCLLIYKYDNYSDVWNFLFFSIISW